jgi:acyl dehydratase
VINIDLLLSLKIPEIRQSYTARDTILYALGVGLGHDPADREMLSFVYERDLRVLPTMAVVLAHPGPWIRDLGTGIDYANVVHGEQSLKIHRTLRPDGRVVGKTHVVDVVDKGAGRGALITADREVFDEATGDKIATVGQKYFCRSEGGFGGPPGKTSVPHVLPTREPDIVVELPTRPESALIYRLSGDYNPLHVDPDVAIDAGFASPIFHGLGTFGVVGHALLKGVCNYDAAKLISMSARFSTPVYPGELIRTEIWCDNFTVSFRALATARSAIVLNNGRARLRSAKSDPMG